MESLRVLQVLAPGPFGGLEGVVEQLSTGLAARGHQVTVAAIVGPGGEEPPVVGRLQRAGVALEAIRVPDRAYHREREAVRRLLASRPFDVAHSHGYRPDVLLRGVIQGAGLPAVATAHGFTGGGAKNRFFEWLQTRAFAGFDAVIAVSRPLRERLCAAGVPRSRVHLIPNAWAQRGAPLDRAEARAALGLPAQGPIMGWVGRLTREKGADVALEALASVPHGDLRVAFLGAGREEATLREQAGRLGVADRVHWLGIRTGAADLLSAFDAVVLSSRTEGTPLILLEAMAAGVPVVATAVGGVPDVVTEREALLVPPGRPDLLARAMALVMEDPGAAGRRVLAAGDRLREAFALDPWLDRHETLYRSLG